MNTVLEQLKERRKSLKLNQQDLATRIGMSRQQYQHLESKGNPRLETLELLAKGLNAQFILIPEEKRAAVLNMLQPDHDDFDVDDPWRDILGDLE